MLPICVLDLAAMLSQVVVIVVFALTVRANRHCRYKAGKHGGVDRSDNGSGISSDGMPLVCVQQ